MKTQFSLASALAPRATWRLLLWMGAALFLTSFSQAFADELGATVTITDNYSTQNTVSSTLGTGTVVSGGFTVLDTAGFNQTLEALPDAVDFTNTSSGALNYPGSFNGYQFAFSGGSSITGVSIASDTISGFSLSDVSFDGDDVWINLVGLTIDSEQGFSLDLDFGPVSTTPEPGSLILLGTGLILLFGAMRWRLRGNRPCFFPVGSGGL